MRARHQGFHTENPTPQISTQVPRNRLSEVVKDSILGFILKLCHPCAHGNHQEKVPSFNMHVTDANMHVTVHMSEFCMMVQNSNMMLQNFNMAFQNFNMAFQRTSMHVTDANMGKSQFI
jgi:hypothetical protein